MQTREHQFKIGDKAVYPSRGVVEVISIEEKDIAGIRQQLYVLKLLDADQKIMVPVQNAANVGLRPPSTETDIQAIFSILRTTKGNPDKQAWNRRQRGFADKINNNSVFDTAEVMRDLYQLQTEKLLSFSERRLLERARNLVVKEIAVTRSRSEDKIQAEIEQIFSC